MRPVFANSAWIGAPERAILRNGGWRRRKLRVRYGLVVHPRLGPILIDTGYTAHALHAPGRSAALRVYGRLLRPQLNLQDQPEPFLQTFGLVLQDIAHVIVTHFHADHVSGLAAFPRARFIASGAAWAHLRDGTAWQSLRHGVFRELIPADFGTRLTAIEDVPRRALPDLGAGYDILGDGSILAVPLPGHADGHFGLLFPHLATPLLYAADTQWIAQALPQPLRPRLLPRLVADNLGDLGQSSDRVLAFHRAGGAVLLCHDDAASPFDQPQDRQP